MGEAELFELVRAANGQIAALYGQLISITFAMVVAIYYFLNRSGWPIKVLAWLIYLVGAFMFIGLMLEESNMKRVALDHLAQLADPSSATRDLMTLHQGWLFRSTAILMNAGLWALVLSVTWLLFIWRRPAAEGS